MRWFALTTPQVRVDDEVGRFVATQRPALHCYQCGAHLWLGRIVSGVPVYWCDDCKRGVDVRRVP